MSAIGRKTRQLGSLFSQFVGAIVYPPLQRKGDSKAADPNKVSKDASHSRQQPAGAKEVDPVCLFVVIVVHVVNAHVQSGSKSERSFSALSQDGGPCHGVCAFTVLDIIRIDSATNVPARRRQRYRFDRAQVQVARMDVVFAVEP